MGFDYHLYVTDLLLFLVAAAAAWSLRGAWQDPRWRETLRSILADRRAAWGLVVLAPYVAVALVDSVHFSPQVGERDGEPVYSTASLSLLDVALSPLRESRESTYSAPLAVRSFAKESIEGEGGASGSEPSPSMVRSRDPSETESPMFTSTFSTIPSPGAGTSIVALSLSSVTSASSALTASPGSTSTAPTGTSPKSPSGAASTSSSSPTTRKRSGSC